MRDRSTFQGVTVIFCLILTVQAVFAQASDFTEAKMPPVPEPGIPFAPKSYVCYQVNVPISIDGKLDESSWQKAPWSDSFVDIEGALKPLPRFNTRVKMLWDDTYFYFAAQMEEPHIWAKLSQRDTVIYYDNDFEIFIDPDGDTHHYYELEVNAFGTEWDLFLDKPYRDGVPAWNAPAIHAWDIAGLKTAVHIDGTINDPSDKDKGWSVEVAIPWFILKEATIKKSPPDDGDQWRVNFSRVEWQTEVKDGNYVKLTDPETGKSLPEANWVWSPQGLISLHYPEMWGFVQFSDKAAGTGTDVFQDKPEEQIRWALRQVYYRQKAHFEKHDTFTDEMSLLQLENPKLEGIIWPPQLYITPSLFEAIITSTDGQDKWTITQDGRVF